jgi:hypothetical protein
VSKHGLSSGLRCGDIASVGRPGSHFPPAWTPADKSGIADLIVAI